MASHRFCPGFVIGLMAACGLAGVNSPAWSAQLANPPAPDAKADDGLPNFDIRVDADGNPTARVRQALAAHPKTPESAAALERLRKTVELVTIDDDPYFGTPRYVRAWNQLLSEPVNAPAATVVQQFITDYAALFQIAPAEV